MWSTPAVWKQYNKMAVLHFFLVNSTLIYILFSLSANYIKKYWKKAKWTDLFKLRKRIKIIKNERIESIREFENKK